MPHSAHAIPRKRAEKRPEQRQKRRGHFRHGEAQQIDGYDKQRRLGEIRRAAGDRATMRALHFFGENARVSDMAAAIRSADAAAYARIMRQSAASSESLLQNIFTPAQRDRSLAIGIALARRYLDPIGGVARVHGGGFAGTMQALVPIGAEDGFTRYMESFVGKASVIRAI